MLIMAQTALLIKKKWGKRKRIHLPCGESNPGRLGENQKS